tara:strand:+ start:205 stop:414 length:210 start_codon:yes stop_codon:yes gene_type:complete
MEREVMNKTTELQRAALKAGQERARGFIGCIVKTKIKHGGNQLVQVACYNGTPFTMTCNEVLKGLAAWI